MKNVNFWFDVGEKVTVKNNNFTGIVTMCAIRGYVEEPEKIYYVQGVSNSDWYPEILLKEAE